MLFIHFICLQVTDKVARGYSKTIKRPMDFNTIKSKLSEYETIFGFEKDVKLVVDNCILYNGENSSYSEVCTFTSINEITLSCLTIQCRRVLVISGKDGYQLRKNSLATPNKNPLQTCRRSPPLQLSLSKRKSKLCLKMSLRKNK